MATLKIIVEQEDWNELQNNLKLHEDTAEKYKMALENLCAEFKTIINNTPNVNYPAYTAALKLL